MLTFQDMEKLLELEHLAELRQQQSIDAQRRKIDRHRDSRLRKMRRKIILIAIIALALFALVRIGMTVPAKAEEAAPSAVATVEPTEDPEEDAKIEAALVEQGYYREDLPLSFEEQDYLHTACEEFGVDYNLALAVIHQETGYRNIIGDDGQSAGYMQIQARWHAVRMDKLGVTDLMDPYSNFRVGCNFLSELLARYGNAEDALTAYNSGHPGRSAYADGVLEYLEADKK